LSSRNPRAIAVSPAGIASLLALLFLVLLLGVPLAAVVLRGLEGASWDTLGSLVADPYLQDRLGRTLLQASLSTVLTVALGLPGALAFARYDFAGKRLLRALFTVPFVMPTVVAGAGFLALVGPGAWLGVDLIDSLALVLLAHVFYNHAVVVRMVGGFLEASAPRLRDAAATLGANPIRTALRVTIPLAAPALLAAASLVFIFSFTSFGVLLLLAPAGRWDTLEVEIYQSVARLLRLDTAALLALAQLFMAMLVGGLYTTLQRRVAVPLSGSVPLPRPRWQGRMVLMATLLPSAVLTLAPLGALVYRSLVPPGAEGVTWLGWQAAFAPSGLLGVISAGDALVNSLRFAVASGALALMSGVTFAYAVVRGGWRWLDRASLLPLATSSVTLGLGVLLAWPNLAGSFWGLAFAHALIGMPFVARAVLPSLRSVPPSRLAAATVAGAGPWRRLLRIDLPAMRTSLIAGGGFAVAVSLGEFGASLVLTRPDLATLPVAIYQRLGRPGMENYAAALVLALLLMMVTAAFMVLLDRLGGPGEL